MCWNQHVSLNTFLFSTGVLLLIIYNNFYTQYKIQELNNFWIYAFIFSIILMQLIEFFIWKNINNAYYNNFFSIIAASLIILQPIFSIMILSNKSIRNFLLILYLLIAIPYSIYQFFTQNIHAIKSKTGHLQWKFFYNTPLTFIIWLFFFLFSFIYEKRWFGISIGIILLCIAYYNYKRDDSFGSMWCWMINVLMIYYAFYLLLYLPYYEKKEIC
jgi:hypothetical protein